MAGLAIAIGSPTVTWWVFRDTASDAYRQMIVADHQSVVDVKTSMIEMDKTTSEILRNMRETNQTNFDRLDRNITQLNQNLTQLLLQQQQEQAQRTRNH